MTRTLINPVLDGICKFSFTASFLEIRCENVNLKLNFLLGLSK